MIVRLAIFLIDCPRAAQRFRLPLAEGAAMEPLDRREFFALAAASPLMQSPRPGSMFVCMHETTSDRFDFRTAMEGWAKAGIRAVEPSLLKVREFAQKESPAAA